MATQSSILAWRVPWTDEPSRLQTVGLQRVGHDLVTVLRCFSRVRLFLNSWTVALQAPLSMDSLGKNTGVGGLSLLQWIFPTPGSNPGLQHCKQILYQLSHQGSPYWGTLDKSNCNMFQVYNMMIWYTFTLCKDYHHQIN